MLYSYPAIFEQDEEDPQYVNVTFVDIFPGATFGDSFEDAMRMAKDFLKLMICEAPKQVFPPSDIEQVRKEYPGKMVVMVEVEIDDGELNDSFPEC